MLDKAVVLDAAVEFDQTHLIACAEPPQDEQFIEAMSVKPSLESGCDNLRDN